MAKVLNYGMVGGGPDAFIGDAHRRAISLDESARLVAGVFSRNAEKSKKMGEVLHIEEERCYKDYETMALEEAKREDGIDFVVVVTPNASHYEICKAFLNAGIHVVCDKPVTTTYEKAVELQKLAEVVDSIGSIYDSRLDGFAPAEYAGKPEEIQKWAIEEMKVTAHAAKAMGVDVVTFFMGSPIWKYWYSFPQTSEQMIEEGYQKVKELWSPIMDEFDKCGVKLALEVHPTEIAFDYWSTKKLLDVFEHRPTLGINFDPSHLIWQGLDPAVFILDFAARIYHVHVKDAKLNLNGRNGILGSHITFGDQRRGWNFVSPGHGDVDFDNIIRALNQIGYDGPLSVEWEDSGMQRNFGGKEACEFTKKINFMPSDVAFDDAIKA